MTSSSTMRALLLGAFTTAFAAGFFVGCSNPASGGDDAGTTDRADAGGETEGDGGEKDGGEVEFRCLIDDECPVSERCEESTGKCIAAAPCQDGDRATCPRDDDSYCDSTVGLGCRCVLSDEAPENFDGFCKRRRPACSTCETNEECGNDQSFGDGFVHNPAECVSIGGSKRCLQVYAQLKCSCGVAKEIDGKYFCAPPLDICPDDNLPFCCTTDDECPASYPSCDQQSGRCTLPCTYDFANHTTSGCGNKQVCHVAPEFLESTAILYGAGYCGAPCQGDAECKRLDSRFVCLAEKGSAPRCRPPGPPNNCISDFECEETDPDSMYRGYCERSSGTCKSDSCREGTDQFGRAYNDCKPGNTCDRGTCREQDCLEQGGAALACTYGEFCCGEDRNDDGKASPCTNAAGTVIATKGKCYTAPNPPWCKGCSADNECLGGGAPSSNVYPNLCNGGSCLYACTTPKQCPRGFACDTIPVDCTDDASVCGVANRCQPTGRKDADGNDIKQCTCTSPGSKGGECPNAVCGESGGRCVHTQACIPGPDVCK